MSFEISCHLRFHLVWSATVNLNLFQISKEWFRTLKAISGWDGMGWTGWLSRFDGLLRAPTVLIRYECCHFSAEPALRRAAVSGEKDLRSERSVDQT